ncbi:hypothetical protein TNCV_3827321 [Trichonephila clavipes]|nr:hypothetical protein TNCV_3827321 [Trichonephila clavipes]
MRPLLSASSFVEFITPRKCSELNRSALGVPTLRDKSVNKMAMSRWNKQSIFDAKYAPRTGRPVVENIDKITERIEVDRHVSSRNIAHEP